MLDVSDFIVEKGGDPNKIRESQRRRHAPEDAVDQVIALYEDHRQSKSSNVYSYHLQHFLTSTSQVCGLTAGNQIECDPERDRDEEKGQIRLVKLRYLFQF